MQRDVVVDFHVHFRVTVRANVNARDFAFADAGDADGGLVIEAGDVVEDRADFADAVAADVDVFDLEDEERDDPEGHQNEGADFRCRRHGFSGR